MDVLAIAPRDVVAAEHDEVGMLVAKLSSGAMHIVGRHPPAAVNIGEKADAKSVERRWQPCDVKVGARMALSLDPRRLYLFGADGRRLAP